jgi:hypothetical protein
MSYKIITLDGDIFTLTEDRIKYSGFLKTLVFQDLFTPEKVGDAFLLKEKTENVKSIMEYIEKGIVNEDLDIHKLSYYAVPLPNYFEFMDIEYLRIWLRETWQRNICQRNPSVVKHLINQELISRIPNRCVISEDTAVFPSSHYLNVSLPTVKPTLTEFLKRYKGKVVLAGGAIVCLMLGLEVKDYDLFFVNISDRKEAFKIIEYFIKVIKNLEGFIITPNSWTVKCTNKYQFIFRNYQNIDEIMLGFDLDCCCIVFDGENSYISERAFYAWKTHQNTVDWTRLSSTYEIRLVKYSKRGFGVRVPKFDYTRVDFGDYKDCLSDSISIDKITGEMMITEPLWKTKTEKVRMRKLKGLDALLFLSVTNLERFEKIKYCDYSSYTKEEKRFIQKDVIEYPGRTLYTYSFDGKWMKIGLLYLPSSGRYNGEDNSSIRIDDEMLSSLSRHKIDIELIVQNPGKQISSSFHSLVYTNVNEWYAGEIYKKPLKRKADERSLESVLL